MKLATPPRPSKSRSGPLSSRGGTFMIATLCALLAAAALLVFLRQYRADLTDSDPVRVLVARSLVPKGTPGEVVASERMYRIIRVPKSELEHAAITDPEAMTDRVASSDIYPGHQFAVGDFRDAEGHPGNRLTGFARAMTVPVNPARGMIGQIESGDRVDVVVTAEGAAGLGAAAQIAARDVLVLEVPSKAEDTADDQPATIRVSDEEAATIAAGADAGEVWLVLRPPVKARSHDSIDAVSKARNGGDLKADIDIKVQEGP